MIHCCAIARSRRRPLPFPSFQDKQEQSRSSEGAFPKPDAYGAETQKGQVVGIQKDMVRRFHYNVDHLTGLTKILPRRSMLILSPLSRRASTGLRRTRLRENSKAKRPLSLGQSLMSGIVISLMTHSVLL